MLAYYHYKNSDMAFVGVLDYYYFDPEPHFQHESTGLTVTHWMPLPEPPNDERKKV